MLKRLLSAFAHTEDAPARLRGKYQMNFPGRALNQNRFQKLK